MWKHCINFIKRLCKSRSKHFQNPLFNQLLNSKQLPYKMQNSVYHQHMLLYHRNNYRWPSSHLCPCHPSCHKLGSKKMDAMMEFCSKTFIRDQYLSNRGVKAELMRGKRWTLVQIPQSWNLHIWEPWGKYYSWGWPASSIKCQTFYLPCLLTRRQALSSSQPLRQILTKLRAGGCMMTLHSWASGPSWTGNLGRASPCLPYRPHKEPSFHLPGNRSDQKLNFISLSHKILADFIITCGNSEVIRAVSKLVGLLPVSSHLSPT